MKETKILKEQKVSLETHIMIKMQNLKEPQISKETQITSKSRISKETQITNKPQILKEHTRMWAIKMQISHEGVWWLACASGTWRRRRATWWGEDSHQVKCVTSERRTILHCGLLSSEEPFMASSGCGGMDIKAGTWREPTIATLVLALCSD